MITSPDNSKLKLIRKLADRRWREKEAAFVTEGEDFLEAGLAAGAEPLAVLVDPQSGLDGEPVDPALLADVSALGSGTRVIAIWPIPDAAMARSRVPGAGDGHGPPGGLGHSLSNVWIYLHGVGDPGNVGTIIRSVDAFGAGALVCGRGCADPYGPKAVRATMGSIFSLPVPVLPFEATPAPRVAMLADEGRLLDEVASELSGGGTLCLGAEREGLPEEIVQYCDLSATIPLRAGIDSLNVAAAAAIALERINSAASRPGPAAATGPESQDSGGDHRGAGNG